MSATSCASRQDRSHGRACAVRHASTRVRLTAWYAALLVLVLLALGVSVEALARNRLLADVDNRLANTAEDIGWPKHRAQHRSQLAVSRRRRCSFEDIVPMLGSFASRGLAHPDHQSPESVVRGSEYAPDEPIVADRGEPSSEPHFVSTTLSGDEMRALFTIPRYDHRPRRRPLVHRLGHRRRAADDDARDTGLAAPGAAGRTSALGLGLAIAGGWVLAGRALRPVDRVTAAAAAIAAGDGTATSLGARLPVPPTDDELARLSATFNAMLDRLQASFRAQERFVADASHELRTPLTAIRGNVDVLMRQARTRRSRIDAERSRPGPRRHPSRKRPHAAAA